MGDVDILDESGSRLGVLLAGLHSHESGMAIRSACSWRRRSLESGLRL